MSRRAHLNDSLTVPDRQDSSGSVAHLRRRSESIGAKAIGTLAIGSVALGALAIGALAVGALAIGRLAIGRTRIRRLEIDELVVRRLRITEDMQGPDGVGAEE